MCHQKNKIALTIEDKLWNWAQEVFHDLSSNLNVWNIAYSIIKGIPKFVITNLSSICFSHSYKALAKTKTEFTGKQFVKLGQNEKPDNINIFPDSRKTAMTMEIMNHTSLNWNYSKYEFTKKFNIFSRFKMDLNKKRETFGYYEVIISRMTHAKVFNNLVSHESMRQMIWEIIQNEFWTIPLNIQNTCRYEINH